MAAGALAIANLVLAVVAIAMTLLAKPKKQKGENTVQRDGVDNDLERVYGTRRMFMTVTDMTANGTAIDITREPSLLPKLPDVYSPVNLNGGKATTQTDNKPYKLHWQGPICVAGRLNAAFNKDNRELGDFACEVDEKPYDSEDLVSNAENFKPGVVWNLYLKGGDDNYDSRDYYAEAVGQQEANNGKLGRASDEWTGMIHAACTAFLRVEKKVTFAGIPEFSWELTSNPLWDPRTDGGGFNWNKPDTWNYNPQTLHGRPSNPILQLLDYMLDKEYGAGIDIAEFDLESWSAAADIADILVGVKYTNEDQQDSFYNWSAVDLEGNPYDVAQTEITLTDAVAVRPLLLSNITLTTEDSIAENMEQLLAATRGARLFKDKNGKWKINPAWLIDDPDLFTFPGEGIGAIYPMPIMSSAVTVSKTSISTPEGPWTTISPSEYNLFITNGSTGVRAKDLRFTGANYNNGTNTLVIDFPAGQAPDATVNMQYELRKVKNSQSSAYISFVPQELNFSPTGSRWTVTGNFRSAPNKNVSYSPSGANLQEVDPYYENKLGLQFQGSGYDNQTLLRLQYPDSVLHPLPIAAHIMRTPTDVGLDYDETLDADGNWILPIGDAEVEYISVTTDDKFNQCVVKFPDEFIKYKINEVEWPETDSDQYLEFFEADNNRKLTETISTNSITDKATALDYAEFIVRQSRSMDSIQMTLGPLGLMLEPNDIVKVADSAINTGNPETLEDLSYYWRVVSTKVNTDLTVQVSLSRYESEDYTFLSKFLADRKYTPVLAPIPVVTFGPDPLTVYNNKMAGYGELEWIPPEWSSTGLTYWVTLSRQLVWDSSVSYAANDIVFDYATGLHYRALQINTNVPPGSDTNTWESMGDLEDTLWEFIGDTSAIKIVIPNVQETRFYTYQVQCKIPLRGLGDGAFYTHDIEAFDPSFASNLRVDMFFQMITLPKDGAGVIDLSQSQNSIWLYAGNDLLPLYGTEQPPGDTPSEQISNLTQGTWFLADVKMNPDNVVLLENPAFDPRTVDDDGADFDHVYIYPLKELLIEQTSYSMTLHAVYKGVGGAVYHIYQAVQYTVGLQGADGIDGGTIAQVSIFRQTGEVYDANNELIPPAPPGQGSFNFNTNTLVAPPQWSSYLNSVWLDGAVWTSSAIVSKTQGNAVSPITAEMWSTPDLYAMYGGTNARISLYRRSEEELNSADKPATNELWYDFKNNVVLEASTGLELPANYPWKTDPPIGNETLWVIQCQFSIPGAQGIDKTSTWSDPSPLGLSGKSVYNGIWFQRKPKGVQPSPPPADNLVAYNFDTESYERSDTPGVPITGLSGWFEDIPPEADGTILWVIREAFSVFGGFGTDPTSTWSDPVVYVKDGTDGVSTYQWTIYQRRSDGSTPATPLDGVWDFDNPLNYTLPLGGWLIAPPGLSESSDVLWTSTAVASSPDPKGVDDSLTWTVPNIHSMNGQDGRSSEIIFQRSKTTPTKPADSLGVPAGWYDVVETVPPATGPDDILWQSTGYRETATSEWKWNKPVQLEAGAIAAEVALYKRADVTPNVPSGNLTYNFSTHRFTGLPFESWFDSVPVGAPTPVYMIKAVAVGKNATSTDIITPSDWSVPTQVFKDGDPGEDGPAGDPGAPGNSSNIIYQRAVNQPATPAPSATAPNGWYDDIANMPDPSDATFVMWASVGVQKGTPNYVWQKPVQLEAGAMYAEVSVWQRKTTAPTLKPALNAFRFDFSTKSLTATGAGNANGWSVEPPSGSIPMWLTRATAVGSNQFSEYLLKNTDWGPISQAWTDGEDGTIGPPGVIGPGGVSGTIRNSSANITVAWDGTITMPTPYVGTGNSISLTEGSSVLGFNAMSSSYPSSNSRFNVAYTFGGGTASVPSCTVELGVGAKHTGVTAIDTNPNVRGVSVRYDIRYRTSQGVTGLLYLQMTMNKVSEGASGFIFIYRTNIHTAPTITEIPYPGAGQVAIIENKSTGEQAGWIYSKNGDNKWTEEAFIDTQIIRYAAVETLTIKGEAVTIPKGLYGTTNKTISTSKTNLQVIQVDWGSNSLGWPSQVMVNAIASMEKTGKGGNFYISVAYDTSSNPAGSSNGQCYTATSENSDDAVSTSFMCPKPTSRYMYYAVQVWKGDAAGTWTAKYSGLSVLGARR